MMEDLEFPLRPPSSTKKAYHSHVEHILIGESCVLCDNDGLYAFVLYEADKDQYDYEMGSRQIARFVLCDSHISRAKATITELLLKFKPSAVSAGGEA